MKKSLFFKAQMLYFSMIVLMLVIGFLVTDADAQTYIKGNNLIQGVTTTATSGGTTTLTKDSQTNQQFTGTLVQTIVLPNATTIPIGRQFYLTNRSTQILTVQDNGGNTLGTILPDMQMNVVLITAGTANGNWDVSNIKVDLASTDNVTGVLPIANGGTNSSTALNDDRIMISSSGSIVEHTALSASQPMKTNLLGLPTTGLIDLTTDVTGILPVANGGTGASSLTNHGVLLGQGTAAVTATSAGTLGQILQSQGASADPTWTTATYPATTTINQLLYSSANNTVAGITASNTSALVSSSAGVPSWALGTTANRLLRTDGTTVSFAQAVLTTDVTGVLPVANGGSGTSTAFTTGSVIFAGSSGIYSQDNSNFFWDDTNNILGIGTGSPNTSSIVDLTSTTKGFLPPRMTTTQRNAIGTPATGLVIYNTTTSALEYYDGSAWQAGGGGLVVYNTPQSLSAAGTITASSDKRQRRYVQGNGGAVTASTTTAITAGIYDGQEIYIMGYSDSNTVTILNQGNVKLRGDITLGYQDMIYLMWDATDAQWIEISRSQL